MLRQQVAQMQALSREAAALSAKPATPLIEMSKQNIEAALARNGLKPQSVMLTGDFAKVQLASVSFAGTMKLGGRNAKDRAAFRGRCQYRCAGQTRYGQCDIYVAPTKE